MRARRWLSVAALALLVPAACGKSAGHKSAASGRAATTSTSSSAGANEVDVASSARFGQFLVDSTGRTLYHFDRDAGGAIACTGSCRSVWPPLLLPAGAEHPTAPASLSGLGAATRPDGGRQVTYQGRPKRRRGASGLGVAREQV